MLNIPSSRRDRALLVCSPFSSLSGSPWTQHWQCVFLRVLPQIEPPQLMFGIQWLPASFGDALMAAGRDFGSVVAEQSSATCCAQAQLSSTDRWKLPLTPQLTTRSWGTWCRILPEWPNSVRLSAEQSSCLAGGGGAESGEDSNLLLPDLKWAQAPTGFSARSHCPKVSSNVSCFLLGRAFGGNIVYVHVPQYQNQGCLVRGCYKAVLEVQTAFSWDYLLLEYYCLLWMDGRMHLQV